MDQLVHHVLRFDRFELDLSSSCLRVGGQTIDLRPQTFAVLQQLAENAGRLVTRDAFARAVWRDVVVGDDSLSRCIRELRQVLGDSDRRLIKTVSRRGYLLNATPVAMPSPDTSTTVPQAAPADASVAVARKSSRWVPFGAAAVISITIVVGFTLFASGRLVDIFSMRRMDDLVSAEDGRRIAALAAEKGLPLPDFHIEAPAQDVPDNVRKFVGVWVSDTGWVNSQRQLMMIVASVSRDGTASGYWVNGPAKPQSRIPGAAFSGGFIGHVSGDTLRYDGSAGLHFASFTADGSVQFKLIFKDGTTGLAMLHPIWTLQKREANAQPRRTSSIETDVAQVGGAMRSGPVMAHMRRPAMSASLPLSREERVARSAASIGMTSVASD